MFTQIVRYGAIASMVLWVFVANAQSPISELEAPTVEVVGTTPLPGLGTPVRDVPANVQIRTGEQIEEQKTTNIGDFLERNLGSVTVNNGQNNPFQPDLSFRGLTASPLLGTPQGLSVFMDGVRINEPFGDAVNWDLIPQNAVSTINLIPGSNPVFGLNTLGGALSINTKSGFQYPGGSLTAYGGSWGRKVGQLEYGGHGEKNDWYVAGTLFDEDGWRDYSPSEVRQLFGKWGREDAETDFDVSLMLADNDLQGTQALPVSFLDNRAQAYTWPDQNKNKLVFVNAKGSHFLSDTRFITGNVYLRDYENINFSSNVNDECEDGGINPGFCAGGAASGEPQAINDLSETQTRGYGGSLQVTFLDDFGGKNNQLTVGASADLGDTTFTQSEEEADFTPERGTTSTGAFALETDVETTNRYYGIYFTDTWQFTDIMALTLAGRYNYAKVEIEDRTGLEPQLNGSHTYTRFNPAIGLNVNPSPSLTTYASYSEGMRAPTPIELTCADPNAPCRLPNNFLADPPLDEVVSQTLEFGARGEINSSWGWNAAIYNIDLSNDIQFISAGGAAINAGYFDNVGDTRRRGFELGGSFTSGGWRVLANYSYVNATYESSFAINSPHNSSADLVTGDIQVNPGDKIPGIPEHAFKLRADYAFLQKWTVGGTLNYFGSQYMRGDENNQNAAGKVPSYTLVNLDARYQATQSWQVFLKVQNVFDEEYETLGVLGENFFVNGTFDAGNVQSEPFLSVGSPRAAWIGVTYAFGS